MRVYLSIDLDYWCLKGSPDAFFRRVFKLGLPIFVAPFHDQLLHYIDGSDCDTLINVDYHADLIDMPNCWDIERLTEGTWGNFIAWKETGRFIWRYPSEVHRTAGYCHGNSNPFTDPTCCGWHSTRMREGLTAIPWKKIEAVGVCLSTAWLKRAPITPVVDRLGIKRWTRMSLWDQRRYATPFLHAG